MENGFKVGQEITLLSRMGLVGPGELRIHLRVHFRKKIKPHPAGQEAGLGVEEGLHGHTEVLDGVSFLCL